MARRPVPPPPTRFGGALAAQAATRHPAAQAAIRPAAAQAATRQPAMQAKSDAGYRLVLGAYLHQDAARLPAELAGHGFVAIERPDGRREAFGFSPANYGGMDPKRDFARLNAGVQGKVHGDSQAFAKPGAVTRAVPISQRQAQAALAKVAEYQTGHRAFSATRCQCTDFAKDVARAAGVDAGPARGPRAFYDSLRKK